ncbi:hypothetical protein V1289_006461 [Bradyrhizobium sp. AZCC 2289]
MPGARSPTPGQRTRVIQEIVADGYLLVAKGLPKTPDPSGVLATIEISMLRSLTISSPKPAAKRSRLVSGSSKKTAVARKSPLEKAASQTFSYNSSGDLAYRIASLVAFNAANVRATFLSSPSRQRGRPLGDLCGGDA